MAKKAKVRDYDQFIVRLPPGLRDRIKATADRSGMSMNEAVVWCLDQYFPAPASLDERLDDLANLVAILKGDDSQEGVERLIDEVHRTLYQLTENRIRAPRDFRLAVKDRYERFLEEEQERMRDAHNNPFDYSLPTDDADPGRSSPPPAPGDDFQQVMEDLDKNPESRRNDRKSD